MRCQDIMKQTVECIAPDDSVQSAARRMREANVGFLPVCGEGRKVLGTITDRDLTIRVLAESLGPSTPVGEVYTREVVACSPRDELRTAADVMARNQKSRIMCLDADGTLVGVISLSDIAAQGDVVKASQTLREIAVREV